MVEELKLVGRRKTRNYVSFVESSDGFIVYFGTTASGRLYVTRISRGQAKKLKKYLEARL